jgi:hypothetical protein
MPKRKPKIKVNKRLALLKWYPTAVCENIGSNGVDEFVIYEYTNRFKFRLGSGHTESEAWRNAYNNDTKYD